MIDKTIAKLTRILIPCVMIVTSCATKSERAQAQERETIGLANSGFESGTLAGWGMRVQLPSDAQAYSVEGAAAVGRFCARITVDSRLSTTLGGDAYLSRADLPREPGTYRISYWVKTKLSKGYAGVELFAQDSENKVLEAWKPGDSGIPIARGSTPWTKCTFDYQIPKGTARILVQFACYGALATGAGPQAPNSAWLDELTVESIPDGQVSPLPGPDVPGIGEVCGPPVQQPCRAVHPLKGFLYTDPTNGHPMVALNSSTPPRGAALLVDYSNPKHLVTTALPFPNNIGGWDISPLPNHHLLFESIGDPLTLVDVDTATRSIAAATQWTGVPSNSYAWQFVGDGNGAVYYGSYPTCHAYRYDAATRSISDLGSMDVDCNGKANNPPNTYVRHIGITRSREAETDGWLLSSISGSANGQTSGVVVWKNGVAGYPKMVADTLGSSPILCTIDGPAAGQKIVFAFGFADGRRLQQFDPRQMRFVDASLPPANMPVVSEYRWDGVVEGFNAMGRTATSKGTYFSIEGNRVAAIFHVNLLKGAGSLIGVDAAGNLVGQRGQSLFVCQPNPQTLADRLEPLFSDVNNHPPALAPMFLRSDPAGGVTGAPSFGQSLFRYNPRHPETWINTDQALVGDGEIYDGRWYQGKFYYVSYAGGDLTVWDPSKPWNQMDDINPRGLVKSGYPRPQGGMVQNPVTNRFYSGWSGPYYTFTGGLTEYDPSSNSIRHWEANQFDSHNKPVSIGAVATDQRYVYGVTSNYFNGTESPEAQPQTFWMFDPTGHGTVLARIALGTDSGCSCFCVPGTNHVWVALPDGLRRFNLLDRSLGPLLQWPVPCTANTKDGCRFDTLGDSAWLSAGTRVLQLHDGPVPRLLALFNAPDGVTALAANPVDRTLYVASGINLYATPLR